ncbi:hypothetical protein [Kitasatospora sp. Ki12]
MSDDQPGRQARRRPLAQPFSHADAAVDQPYGERLLPVQRLDTPFSTEAGCDEENVRVRPASRRPLGPGDLAARTPA